MLVASPTGSGKTLAFGIPMIERTARGGGQPSALVLVPTRELASQVVDELRPLAQTRGLRIEAVYGGTSVMGQAKKARGAEILVATPGRLDRPDRPAARLARARSGCSCSTRPTACSTWASGRRSTGCSPRSPPTGRRCSSRPRSRARSRSSRAPTRSTPSGSAPRRRRRRRPGEIEHEFHAVTTDGQAGEPRRSSSDRERGLALVFVRTKHGADKLATKLHREHDVPSVVMHGNMSQNARERSLARFESGQVTTLIATDVAARGLDIDDITHVINFDPPRTE